MSYRDHFNADVLGEDEPELGVGGGRCKGQLEHGDHLNQAVIHDDLVLVGQDLDPLAPGHVLGLRVGASQAGPELEPVVEELHLDQVALGREAVGTFELCRVKEIRIKMMT